MTTMIPVLIRFLANYYMYSIIMIVSFIYRHYFYGICLVKFITFCFNCGALWGSEINITISL